MQYVIYNWTVTKDDNLPLLYIVFPSRGNHLQRNVCCMLALKMNKYTFKDGNPAV